MIAKNTEKIRFAKEAFVRQTLLVDMFRKGTRFFAPDSAGWDAA